MECDVCIAQIGEWTWMKGYSIPNSTGNFGIQGIPSSTNEPPALYEPLNWTDHQGNFWLFGGVNYYPTQLYNSALWKFDPSTNEWTWIKGPSSPDQPGVYGTQGIPDINNYPGARSYGSSSWVDLTGILWLFGGDGYDANGVAGKLNDLWKYDISTNEWTWMKGSSAISGTGDYGTIGTEAASNDVPSRTEACGTWTVNGNFLWLFGGVDYNWDDKNDLWRYNTNTNNWTWMKGSSGSNAGPNYGTMGIGDSTNDPGSRYVYSRWLDCYGNFIFFGGWKLGGFHWNDVWKFDIASNEWVWLHGPSSTNQGSITGNYCESDSSFNPHSRGESKACWRDAYGKLWLFGGFFNPGINVSYNDLWVYDPIINEWSFVSGSTNSNQQGSFGQQQVYNPSNIPPSKTGSASWIDAAGNLWLFGGFRSYLGLITSTNDLWKYVPDYTCTGTNSCPPFSTFIANDTTLCQKFCINFIDASQYNPTSWLWLFPGGDPSSSTLQNPTSICYNSPGTYDVTLITTNATGNDTFMQHNYIIVYPTPLLPVISQSGYTLTSSPAPAYQWQFNNADIPGATNQTYQVIQSGFYTIVITDDNGCSSSSAINVLITSIDDISANANVLIYPNPSDGSFIVELSNCQIDDELKIEIRNMFGQIVFSSEEKISLPDWKIEIDLRRNAMHCVSEMNCISAGIYLIEISGRNTPGNTQDVVMRKKIIISK